LGRCIREGGKGRKRVQGMRVKRYERMSGERVSGERDDRGQG